MLPGQEVKAKLASPFVFITNGGSHSPRTWAEMITNKILYVGENVHPAIKVQAEAYRNKLCDLLEKEIKNVLETDRLYRK